MVQQRSLRALVMRGGTSKGIYINENQLPSDQRERDQVILRMFGSPDRRQIDGIGGADLLTSKCCVMGPPSRADADIDYTFVQVSVELPEVSYDINCGNLSPGAAVFAIREGFVRVTEPVTTVRIHNTNLNRILTAYVPICKGEPAVDGDYAIDGVPGTGAEVVLDYSKAGGGTTGKLLPMNAPAVSVFLPLLGREITVSVVDIGNLTAFVRAEDFGMTGTEIPDEAVEKYKLFGQLQEVIAEALQMKDANLLPFTVAVSKSQEYITFGTGTKVSPDDCDFVARLVHGPVKLFKTGVMHKAFPGTASVATAVAALIPGTVVNEVSKARPQAGYVRIGHPSGSIKVTAEVDSADEVAVRKVFFSRTVRPIMEGHLFVPESFYAASGIK
ncbi:MAG: PrpF domain-containing protein [Peptococcaceae bacterium]